MATRHAWKVSEKDLISAVDVLDSLNQDIDERGRALHTIAKGLLHVKPEIRSSATKKVKDMFLHPKHETLQLNEASNIVFRAIELAVTPSQLIDLLEITTFVDKSIENTRKQVKAVEDYIMDKMKRVVKPRS